MFLCPVLHRPRLASSLLASWRRYSSYPLTLLIAHDDPAAPDYIELVSSAQDAGTDVHFLLYPHAARGTLSALNYDFRAQPSLGYYGFIGEDCELRTPNLALVPLANYFAISWPDDGFHSSRLATHPVLGGELVRAVGHLAPSFLFHSFFDNYWTAIGQGLALLHYCRDVVLHHDNPAVTGRPPDAVNRIAASHFEADHQAFLAWHNDGHCAALIRRLEDI